MSNEDFHNDMLYHAAKRTVESSRNTMSRTPTRPLSRKTNGTRFRKSSNAEKSSALSETSH